MEICHKIMFRVVIDRKYEVGVEVVKEIIKTVLAPKQEILSLLDLEDYKFSAISFQNRGINCILL